jgi:type III secretion system YscQ/HrcQ family protein
VNINDAGLTLTRPLREATAKDRELWMMVDSKPMDGRDAGSDSQERGDASPGPDPALSAGAPAADAAFDDLPIKVVFELGRVEMSLGRLQELGPGHVFELERPLGRAVEVLAGGRRIGQGEIVRIGEQVGVRMVRLFGHG